jgi:hypothetical protein
MEHGLTAQLTPDRLAGLIKRRLGLPAPGFNWAGKYGFKRRNREGRSALKPALSKAKRAEGCLNSSNINVGLAAEVSS